MTDAQLSALMGYSRPPRGSSLMPRLRAVVAAAQAEQSAQIERMRAALEDVRPLIGNLEKMLRQILNLAGQPRSADEAAAFARLHDAMRMIDEAMGGNDAQG